MNIVNPNVIESYEEGKLVDRHILEHALCIPREALAELALFIVLRAGEKFGKVKLALLRHHYSFLFVIFLVEGGGREGEPRRSLTLL